MIKISQILNNKIPNNLLPFFWQHGEDEATLRHYMKVIQQSGCGSVCVESRPHPDFCGPKWWQDMDVIIDEAKTRGMQVWILDDDHFPTGHANGMVDVNKPELARRSIYCKSYAFAGGNEKVRISSDELNQLPEYPKSRLQMMIEQMSPPKHRHHSDDRIISVYAVKEDDRTFIIDLTDKIVDGGLVWDKPDGKWIVYQLGVSGNLGAHRDYINMMDEASCRVLIDAVYEPHFARYGEYFGNVVAGFFSDEPELGNGGLYIMDNTLGTPQDLPWSNELEQVLADRLGDDKWKYLLPLLWENSGNTAETAYVRYHYMDAVSRLVEKNFSRQIGGWCRDHGVKYIGHVIEDENHHARTGSSLGHFFRGLAGQDMAGIDDIGGQVLPQGEDEPVIDGLDKTRDGEFFHYMLGKLASSHAAIDPLKQGNAMCEIFGNYGWSAGVRLEKYLVDHFLVRGVNHYVPHAFSPKEYPDPDCPPHFYAHGNNPQYRHFGKLMEYTNRVSQLISGGRRLVQAAILYHAEAEWSGGSYMLSQKPARVLMDNQIDFDVIPADVFTEIEIYKTITEGVFRVNKQAYQLLIIPQAQYLASAVVKAAITLQKQGIPVIFIDSLPQATCDTREEMPSELAKSPVVALQDLQSYLAETIVDNTKIEPKCDHIRALHYQNHETVYMFVNEGTDIYQGRITLPTKGKCAVYDAWENRLEPISYCGMDAGTEIDVEIKPLHSLIIIFGDTVCDDLFASSNAKPDVADQEPADIIEMNGNWQRSICRSIDYPKFGSSVPVELPEDLELEMPEFSGFIRYETSVELNAGKRAIIEIEDAHEGVELFVNDISAGIQIVPPFSYDITSMVQTGENKIAIEVATTLERERAANPLSEFEKRLPIVPASKSGITGDVKLRLRGLARI